MAERIPMNRESVRRQKNLYSPVLKEFFSCVRRGNVSQVRDHFVNGLGIDVNCRDPWDNCPLYLACLCGHPNMVKYLLQAGARYDMDSVEGERCFLSALTMDIRNILKEHNNALQVVKRATVVDSTFDNFLQNMYERTPDFDVQLVVSGQRFMAHKCMLCVRCDYFRARLMSQDSATTDVLELTDPLFTLASTRAILQFIYTGSVDLPICDVEETQRLAAFLGFITLAQQIDSEMKNTSTRQNDEELSEMVLNVEHKKLKHELQSDLGKLVLSAVPLPLQSLIQIDGKGTGSVHNNIFCDVCFSVEDQMFECHKIFFYGRSDYFRILLIEKQEDQPPAFEGYRPVIKLDHITAKDFVQIVTYLYQDQCNIDASNHTRLLDIAERWTLPSLKNQIQSKGEKVTAENVIQTYQSAKQEGNERLLAECYKCMASFMLELGSKYEFQEFLKSELTSNNEVISEKQRFLQNQSNQEIPVEEREIIKNITFHIRHRVSKWQQKKCANEKIQKLNYILSNRLGFRSDIATFDVPSVPPSSNTSVSRHVPKHVQTHVPTHVQAHVPTHVQTRVPTHVQANVQTPVQENKRKKSKCVIS